MKKQSLFIVLIVLCIITMAVGYSIFRTNIEVSGKTAEAKDLEVIFTNVGEIKQEGCTYAKAIISENKKKITISVEISNQKGSFANFPITLKNVGLIPAKLRSIRQIGTSNFPLEVRYTGIGVTDLVLNPGDEQEFNVIVSLNDNTIPDKDSYKFYIDFDYIQG